MAGFTNFYSDRILNNIFRNVPASASASGSVAWTNVLRPPALYIGLFTATGSAQAMDTFTSGSPVGTEVATGSYARQQVTQGDANWSAPITGAWSGSATENAAAINFPQATADWGTVVAWGLFDSPASGNLIMWSPLNQGGTPTPRSVPNGAVASFASGALDITLD